MFLEGTVYSCIMIKLSLALAFRNIVRNGRRSVMAILAIGFGITSLLLAGGFIEWNLRYGRESTIHSQLGHIRLFKPGYLESGQSDPSAFLFPLTPKQLERVRADLPVRTIAPRLSFSGLVSHEEATISFIGEGVDPDLEGDLSRSITVVAGQAMSSDDPKGILLGQGLAANLGVQPGDLIVLVVNTAGGRINAVEGSVRGLFATITKAYDDSALRLPGNCCASTGRILMRYCWIGRRIPTRCCLAWRNVFEGRRSSSCRGIAWPTSITRRLSCSPSRWAWCA